MFVLSFDVRNMLFTLSVIFGIQVLFFILAAALRSDNFTDLSYGLTFVIVALLSFRLRGEKGFAHFVLLSLVCLGETLCWWGILLYCSPILSGSRWFATLSPVYITLPLLFVTGTPLLKKSAKKRCGNNLEYQRYRRRTSFIIPLPQKKEFPIEETP